MKTFSSHPRLLRAAGITLEFALGVAVLAVVYLHLAPNVQGSATSTASSKPIAVDGIGPKCGTPTVCLTDDNTGDVLTFSCPSGAYTFTHTGSSPVTLTGTGTISTPSSVESVSDRKPDRRVTGGLLLSQGTGSAVVYFTPIPGGPSQVFHINQTVPFRPCAAMGPPPGSKKHRPKKGD